MSLILFSCQQIFSSSVRSDLKFKIYNTCIFTLRHLKTHNTCKSDIILITYIPPAPKLGTPTTYTCQVRQPPPQVRNSYFIYLLS